MRASGIVTAWVGDTLNLIARSLEKSEIEWVS